MSRKLSLKQDRQCTHNVPVTIVAIEKQQCISELRLSLLVGVELTLNAGRRTDGRTDMTTLFGVFHVNANALNEDKVSTSQRTVFAVVTDVMA